MLFQRICLQNSDICSSAACVELLTAPFRLFRIFYRRIESALRRFKREVNKSGHLQDLRHHRYHENAQEKKKRKAAQARMRKRFERMQRRRMQLQNRV